MRDVFGTTTELDIPGTAYGNPPYDRALALAGMVRTMRDHYLAVRCGCGAARVVALLQVARDRKLANCTLAHVALRLSCDGCFGHPDEVHLTATIFGVGPLPQRSLSLAWTLPLVERTPRGSKKLKQLPG